MKPLINHIYQQLVNLLTLFLLFGFCSFSTGQTEELSLDEQIREARSKEILTRSEFEVQKRLLERGATSQRDFRIAEYRWNIATVEVALIEQPAREDEFKLLRARIKAEFTQAEFQTAKRLAEKSTVSQLTLKRFELQARMAELELMFEKARNDTKKQAFVKFKMTAIELELAKSELETGRRLFAKGSISQLDVERLEQKVRDLEATWRERKDAIKASATMIERN